MIYFSEDLEKKARRLAKAVDPRATRVSWAVRVDIGRVELMVTFRAGGEVQEVREYL